MRQAGTLSNREQAQRLADYLLTQGITTKVDADGDAWAVWVRDEDQLPQAVQALQEFQADPDSPRYQAAITEAQSLRKRQQHEDQQRQKNFIEMRDRWNTRPSGSRPLTILLIVASVLEMIAVQGGDGGSRLRQYLWFAAPPQNAIEERTWTPLGSIESGEVWRLVTPIFIHRDLLHLAFNMFWLYQLGSLIEVRRGTLRFGLLVLVVAALSNYGQYFFPFQLHWDFRPPTVFFGGMSGVVYGLFGYVWMKARFQPLTAMFLAPFTVELMLIWLVLCWTGLLGPVANWAHTVGLAVGMAIGYAPVGWRRFVG